MGAPKTLAAEGHLCIAPATHYSQIWLHTGLSQLQEQVGWQSCTRASAASIERAAAIATIATANSVRILAFKGLKSKKGDKDGSISAKM